MSCPDWRVLQDDSAEREARAGARRHLRTCEPCRRAALAADPTVMFALCAEQTEVSPAMVERMRERVAGARAMRVANAKGSALPASRRDLWLRRGSRVAAAVLLPLAGFGLISMVSDRLPDTTPGAGDAVAVQPLPAVPVDPLLADALARLPLIEGAVPVTVQEEGIGYDLVMVVDAGLEL